MVDLSFPVQGERLAMDHGYPLYGALSRQMPWLHDEASGGGAEAGHGGEESTTRGEAGVFRISGAAAGGGLLQIDRRSRLRLRVAELRLVEAVGLTGALLEVDGHKLRLGPPTVHPLRPAATLKSRLVLIKIAHTVELTPEAFLAAADRQLAVMEIDGEASIPLHKSGPRVGQPQRKVMRIKGAVRVGYPLLVGGLSADDSLRLQEQGLGGRRRMGCGLFLPVR